MSGADDTAKALRRVQPQWHPERTERLLAATHGRLLRRRAVRRTLAISASVLALAAVGLGIAHHDRARSTAAPSLADSVGPHQQPSARLVRFVDGSSVELSGAESSIQVHEVSPERIMVELEHGDAHFRVTTRPERRFVARAGNLVLQVIGTEFDVGLRGTQTWVAVTHGQVRVDWAHATANLGAGARGLFPPDESPGPTPSTADSHRPVDLAPSGSLASRWGSDARQSYREQVDRKDYAAAYQTMDQNPAVVGSSAAELMLAADVARQSGHPARAIPYLQRVVDEHAGHPEAPLAAFTLGRIFTGMGQHERAEQLFAKAGGLAPHGQLAEDALARQVWAAARAGDRAEAQRLGREYLRRFPQGRRTEEVRRNAGL